MFGKAITNPKTNVTQKSTTYSHLFTKHTAVFLRQLAEIRTMSQLKAKTIRQISIEFNRLSYSGNSINTVKHHKYAEFLVLPIVYKPTQS
jgi:hypothetical protein